MAVLQASSPDKQLLKLDFVRTVMNTQFNFTLKTDDDCFVDVEAIIKVKVLNFKFITNLAVRVPVDLIQFASFYLFVFNHFMILNMDGITIDLSIWHSRNSVT